MTEEQAARTSWHEYQLRMQGRDEELKQRWSIARWTAYQIVRFMPMIKPVARPKKAIDLQKFPWEQETPEQLQEKAAQYKISPEEEAELNEIIKILDKG